MKAIKHPLSPQESWATVDSLELHVNPVTLNTTSLGSITNRDSWCLNYQGLLCLLSSSFLLVLFTLWHLSLFFQVKGQQGHMLPHIWEGGSQVKGASVHTLACFSSALELWMWPLSFKNNRPIHNHLHSFPMKAWKTSRPRTSQRLYSLLFDILELFLEVF